MASISTDKKGLRRILFVGGDGRRRTIRLGRVPIKTARTIQTHVENLAAAALGRNAPDPETSAWVGRLDRVLYDKLATVGLLPPREQKQDPEAVALGAFLDQYIAGRADVKPGTATNLRQARAKLVAYFGADKPLPAITPGDADNFRQDLESKLGINTTRRHCGRAKQFFRAAVRKRLIAENPFADQKGLAVRANPSRFYFVTPAEAEAVLDACPDAQWRLLFALARWGGLRVPSEPLGLRWADVDWARGRLTVHSPKTERHEGGESRQIPIFPEIRPHLEAVWERAEPGTEWVITRYRNSNANLRTQFERIICRAGLTPWPKLFQNLRSTRETELAKTYPLHVVCSWIGNSQRVAARHYLQVTDADYENALEGALGGGAQSGALSEKKAARNAAQSIPADSRQPSQKTHKALENQGLCTVLAKDGQSWQDRQATPTGFEPVLQA
jgi:integrase